MVSCTAESYQYEAAWPQLIPDPLALEDGLAFYLLDGEPTDFGGPELAFSASWAGPVLRAEHVRARLSRLFGLSQFYFASCSMQCAASAPL